ncbi:hypothetical protein Agabi119p4_7810 [Agaricus bisporus var. burnettii]|uniref:Uncharacterized protein n=2 Tax=Agaricus bisporus var. burnettii TaxID=192524 RepID=A0A8H7C7T6_AGABI|nr:hypothetical protein Agabi119p4_7810 [Agaricus bisporus var. burnettii]
MLTQHYAGLSKVSSALDPPYSLPWMSLPRNLPGFVWDPDRNRYFPASSNPPLPSPPRRITTPSRARKPRNFWQSIHQGNTQHVEHLRDPNRHNLLSQHYAETTSVKEQHVPIFGVIRNFVSTTTVSGQNYCLLGDSTGWIFSLQCAQGHRIRPHWAMETNLGLDSEISSLNVCGSYVLATSFGPISSIHIQKLDQSNPSSFFLNIRHGNDIRCADFANTDQIVLGAKQHGIYITNVFDTPHTRILQTNSDVFSVARQQNLVYLGTRNGSIHRFDLRIPKSQASRGLFSNKSQSSVLHMQLINDVHFLSSYMDGQILMHDIRFPFSNTPLLRFEGQVNAYSPRLGITTDPNNDFLFAGGQDRRIRAWSLRNADPVLPKTTKRNLSTFSNSTTNTSSLMKKNNNRNPLLEVFSDLVRTIQITEGRMGMCLWVGYGKQLCQSGLGRRAGDDDDDDDEAWQLWGDFSVSATHPLATGDFR